jgi:hypothetical protein
MTTDANGNRVRYGAINRELIGRWLKMDEADDGPFWALNLMKYREVADYDDGRAPVSGREADDTYAPLDSLAAIGAQAVFLADVVRMTAGDGTAWDRIGIVRYPSRRAFFAMQQRDEFKKSHVHKDAGMEFTIVMSCLPVLPFGGEVERRPFVELRVSGDVAGPNSGEGTFDVEGVIVGDERTWRRATFRWLDAEPAAHTAATSDDRGQYCMILRPSNDRLTRSVLDAADAAASKGS